LKKVRLNIIFAFFLLLFSINFLFFCGDAKVNENKTNNQTGSGQNHRDSLKETTDNNQEKNLTLTEEQAIRLHYDAFVIDSHNDYLYQVFKRGADFGSKDNFTQSGLQRFREGGVDLQVFAVWIPSSEERRAFSFASEQIDRLKRYEEKYPGEFKIALNYEDAVSIMQSGKLCGMIGIEDGAAIMNDIDNVNKLYESGVRYIGLTWNKSNLIGTSSKDESQGRSKKGLTKFGIEVVKRMEELGMMIDVSHCGEQTFRDILDNTSGPIIASHSNCYSVNPHHRNLTDGQIKEIAARGGVIMVNFLDDFIDENAKNKRTSGYDIKYAKEIGELYEMYGNDLIQFNKKRLELIRSNPIKNGTSIDDLIEHIDHIKNLVGTDYIGLGSDFDGGITPPVDLYDATCYPILTAKLAEKGYTETEIRKILGLNFLRVMKKTEKNN
jgi:membrane dipeptidase